MKRYWILSPFISLILFFASSYILEKRKASDESVLQVHTRVKQDVDSLVNWYEKDWQNALKTNEGTIINNSFLRGRQLYKSIEWAVEFFFPSTAKSINGAPVPEIEVEENAVTEASGFQVMEEAIYPYNQSSIAQLQRESKKLGSVLHRLKVLWAGVKFRDDQVWAAARLQLLRITSLGLSGFDTPLSGTSIEEIAYSFKGLQATLQFYKSSTTVNEFDGLNKLFQKAYTLLKENNNFISFDRVLFIEAIMQRLAKQMLLTQNKLNIQQANVYAVNMKAAGYFDTAVFNINYFTSGTSSYLSNEKAALGKMLFSSTILSTNNNRACVTCHQPEKAFTDGIAKRPSFDQSSLKRNTPTVLYAGLQQKQFYDMRAAGLEDQIKNVIQNKDEIHGSLPLTAKRLSANKSYVQLFRKAFNTQIDSISEWQIQVAIASYVRSLAPFNSKFDDFLIGRQRLSLTEKSGFNLFMGKGKCGSCHFMPVFNGTVPPMFTTTESEVLGVPADKKVSTIDADGGRYNLHKISELNFAFKTPTLRNVARTAPYMHNGVFTTLEEVIQFYNEGGAAGKGATLVNQTLPADKLNLSEGEVQQIIAFLQTLNDDNKGF